MAKRKLSPLQKAYREFFMAKMEEYEVSSPSQLSDEDKIEFFNSIKKDWKKQKKSMAEGYDVNQAILDNLELNEEELSPRQQKFREFFNSKLDEFEVDSPDDLSDEDKIEFFNAIDSDWKGLDEGQDFETLEEYLDESGDDMYQQTVLDSEDKIILHDDEDEIEELDEMDTSDIATYDTKISDDEKKKISEVCKSKGFKLIEAKAISKDKAKFIVEKNNSNKRGTVIYDDNNRVFPFSIGNRPFSMLESTLDWISTYTFQTDESAQKFIKEEARIKSKESLEIEKFKNKTTGLSESEQERRNKRGEQIAEQVIKVKKEKPKKSRPIWGED